MAVRGPILIGVSVGNTTAIGTTTIANTRIVESVFQRSAPIVFLFSGADWFIVVIFSIVDRF